jgi:hypothetical protein
MCSLQIVFELSIGELIGHVAGGGDIDALDFVASRLRPSRLSGSLPIMNLIRREPRPMVRHACQRIPSIMRWARSNLSTASLAE